VAIKETRLNKISPNTILVTIECKDGNSEELWLTRKEFLKLDIEQRRKILKEQVEKLIKDCPNYPNEDE